jgi:hypothetical protein
MALVPENVGRKTDKTCHIMAIEECRANDSMMINHGISGYLIFRHTHIAA